VDFTISIYVSGIFKSLSNLSKSYLYAREVMEYKSLCEPSCNTDYRNVAGELEQCNNRHGITHHSFETEFSRRVAVPALCRPCWTPDTRHQLVPMGNESENMVRLMMMDPSLKEKGFSACSYGSPLYQAAAALYYGLKILQGDKSVPRRILVPYPFVTEGQLKLTKTGSAEDFAAGANVVSPDLVGPGFFANIYHPEYTPGLDLNMALTGRATKK